MKYEEKKCENIKDCRKTGQSNVGRLFLATNSLFKKVLAIFP
jgi:hypothetical protein